MTRIVALFACCLLLMAAKCNSGEAGKVSLGPATMQKWVGGAPGSGGGTKYLLTLQKPAKGEFSVKKVYVGNAEKGKVFSDVGVLPTDPKSPTFQNNIAPDGTTDFLVTFRSTWRPNDPSNPDSPIVKKPEETTAPEGIPEGYSGAAIVWYVLDGKDGYLSVPAFKKLEDSYMP